MRYYIISGEASGDLHAANAVKELLKLDPSAELAFTGGDDLEMVTGKKADIHIRQMAFMGFIDVLRNLGTIRKNFRIVKERILAFRPDMLLLVDYPGFNLRMAKWAHEQGIRVDYYISPTVWAWKEGRIEIIRKHVHRMFVILPFEEAFYKSRGLDVMYVGHPLCDAIENRRASLRSREQFVRETGLSGKPIIAVLPGSRKQEIERMMNIMLNVVPGFPEHEFVIAASGSLDPCYYEGLEKQGVKVVYNSTYDLMLHAEAGIIKSGTSTLESALFNLPQVVCYRAGSLSFAIGKRLVNVQYISLPNLILNKALVKELIQEAFSSENISKELDLLLNNKTHKGQLLEGYAELQKLLGGAGASKRLAEKVYADAKEGR